MDYTNSGLCVQTARGVRTAAAFVLPMVTMVAGLAPWTAIPLRVDVARLAMTRLVVVAWSLPLARRLVLRFRRVLGAR